VQQREPQTKSPLQIDLKRALIYVFLCVFFFFCIQLYKRDLTVAKAMAQHIKGVSAHNLVGLSERQDHGLHSY